MQSLKNIQQDLTYKNWLQMKELTRVEVSFKSK